MSTMVRSRPPSLFHKPTKRKEIKVRKGFYFSEGRTATMRAVARLLLVKLINLFGLSEIS